MLRIEIELALATLFISCIYPKLGSKFFSTIEHHLSFLAKRRPLSILLVGTLALALRAALLLVLPVPYPGVEDEFSYLLMSDTFAHGRLANPTPPMWIHLESSLINERPTYCSMYYPAQGAFLALGQLVFGHPFWGVWISCGLMCAAICWALYSFVSPPWAFLGGVLAAIRIGACSYWSNSYWGGAVAALGGALLLGSLPRIKLRIRRRDAVLLMIGVGLLLNSRPYEGLAFAVAGLSWLLFWLCQSDPQVRRRSLLNLATPSIVVLVLTVSFMLYYYYRTTGSILVPPYLVNLRTYAASPNFAWLQLPSVPHYNHESIRQHYVDVCQREYLDVRSHPIFSGIAKLMLLWSFYLGPLLTLPTIALVFALPYGASLSDTDSGTRLLLISSSATLVAILLAVPINAHYAAPATAAFYALLALSMRRITHWRPGGRPHGQALVRGVIVSTLVLLGVRVATPILHLPVRNASVPTWSSTWPQLLDKKSMSAKLEMLPGKHLVLVRYGPHHPENQEWVYNEADVNSSKIVWAHEMSPAEDKKIISYFSDRRVWLLEADQYPPRVTQYAVQ